MASAIKEIRSPTHKITVSSDATNMVSICLFYLLETHFANVKIVLYHFNLANAKDFTIGR